MSMFDEELAGMVNYTDETIPEEMPAMERTEPQKPVQRHSEPMDTAVYSPFHKTERSLYDRLKSMSLWLGICGGIAMLMWWFNVNDLMAMEASYPCILACAIIGGIGVGRSSK